MRAHFKFWPRRLPHAITLPVTSLWDNLAISARRYPDKAALVFFGRATSYRELAAGAERLAARLAALGVQRGDRVVLCMQNCPQLVLAHFAILRANAVVVPVNPMNRAEELKHYITDPDTRLAITTADLAPELARASNALPPAKRLAHLVATQFSDAFDPDTAGADALPEAWRQWLLTRHPLPALDGGQTHAWADALACTAPPPALRVGPDDLALLPYTSGTTGLPKGCMHLHKSIMHNTVASSLWGNCAADNIMLAVAPMFHITGIVNMLHTAIYSAATLVVMPRWDRELAGRLIARHRVTHWTNIPTMIIDLLGSPNLAQHDLSSLVYIGGGGAAMPQAVAQRLFEQYGLRYAEGYGLTETAAPSHANPPEHPRQQCLGIPYMGVDARVVDPETLQEMPVGEQGEIIIHGPQVFVGYWKRPDASASALIEFEGKRFFRSGDLGYVDGDGYFFLTDRIKRMINASGFKVWPAEVEAMMFRHPAIQDACIIATRDSYRGESVKAVVVLRATHGDTTEQQLIDWCRANMAVYKVPRSVQFVGALPKSGSGKVMWRALQEQEQEAQPPATAR
ncbi:long-chain fatty acid--CoA ligase [Verminephrobacter aporrectodeae]|uniref:long-chain fatty acid--CoA ligase n=1 Tax=Verminephrobacter aporrectodeae TaxID=1110389 RepID=UPI002242F5AC|nr:long-chain fatty acid--CoA ligase [Verminephrobacter aporrectodeae]MCW8174607.1 long-chain fatty acid--CoA ligase [Verminephrobacter aporrectodeae subsp. tuberculatae]MCW8203047.1 long-chain fatty acid--CoA ligase [Verminephrobacter aporrectodeae subsp. tuberculatae]MCW8208852.1 long-chain fatty acid--CoA ligase [Verminephrobacter aporrectodeae subsp. tuberculatae]